MTKMSVSQTLEFLKGHLANPAVRDCAVITVTPRVAEFLLHLNANIRNIRPARVNEIAGWMRSGRFLDNGDTVNINSLGKLDDGQHRLSACVATGVPFQAIVSFGTNPVATTTKDQQEKRTLAQILSARGVRGSASQSSIITASILLRKMELAKSFNPIVDKVVPMEADERWREVPLSMMEKAATLATRLKSHRVPHPPLIAAAYLHLLEKDEPRAAEFFDKLADMSWSGVGDPARAFFVSTTTQGSDYQVYGRKGRTMTLRGLVKAWNTFVEHRHVKTIRLSADEAFTWFLSS